MVGNNLKCFSDINLGKVIFFYIYVNSLSAKFNNQCFYCELILPIKTQTKDYFVPLAMGGNNSKKNLVLSCRSCNCNKSSRLPSLEEVIKFKTFNPSILLAQISYTLKKKHKELMDAFQEMFNQTI